MTTRTPLMAGNWKMNLNHLEAIAHVQKLVFALADKDYDAVEVAVLPPFTDLRSVQTMVEGDNLKIKYGAQDISAHDSGAYTGEISGPLLAKLKCTYVAVGHSERTCHMRRGCHAPSQTTRAAARMRAINDSGRYTADTTASTAAMRVTPAPRSNVSGATGCSRASGCGPSVSRPT